MINLTKIGYLNLIGQTVLSKLESGNEKAVDGQTDRRTDGRRLHNLLEIIRIYSF